MVLPDGSLVTKDFGGPRPGREPEPPEPAELLVLDPVDLSVRDHLVLPEPSIARLSADADDVYVVGDTSLLRVRWNGTSLRLDRDLDTVLAGVVVGGGLLERLLGLRGVRVPDGHLGHAARVVQRSGGAVLGVGRGPTFGRPVAVAAAAVVTAARGSHHGEREHARHSGAAHAAHAACAAVRAGGGRRLDGVG